MGEVRFRGEFVEVLADGSWRWHACCRCGRELTTPEAVAAGFGKSCLAAVVGDRPMVLEALRQAARRLDREYYRRWVVFERIKAERAAIREGRDLLRPREQVDVATYEQLRLA